MTLAIILSICLFCSAATSELILASSGAVAALTRPQTSAHQAQSPPSASDQDSPSTSQSVPASPTPAPSVSSPGPKKTKATKGKQRGHKKTPAASASPNASANCPPAATSNTAAADSTGTSSAQTAGAPATTPANCPPGKKIVPDGGTTEPPVELLGGPGGAQASHQRDTTDQLLGSVQNDLKKVEGRQLNSSQQEMVSQIHQFIEQSKAAVATGDVERGHNLAMKAYLLSAELVKP